MNEQKAMIIIPEMEWMQQKQLISNILSKLEKIDIDEVLTDKEYIGVRSVLKSFDMCRSQFEQLKRMGTVKTYKVKGKIYVKRSEIQEVFKNSQQ